MVRLRGEELPGFLDVLQAWLPQQPWFSAPAGRWGLRRTGGLRLPAPDGQSDPRLLLELHILEFPGAEGPERICVPLVLRSRPSALSGKNAFVGRLSDEELGEVWLYDGARDQAFLASWMEMARREQGTRNGRAHGEAYAGFSDRKPYTVKLRRTSVDTDRITRTLITPEGADEADWASRVVVDFLRRPEAGSPDEFELLEALSTARARRVPHLLGVVSGAWEVQKVEGQASAGEEKVAWEYGDLALIREGTLAAPEAGALAAEAGASAEDFTEEARRIGHALGDVHADFAVAFGAYPQTPDQAESAAEETLAALEEGWAAVRAAQIEEHEDRIGPWIASLRSELAAAAEPLMLQTIHGALRMNSFRRPSVGGHWVVDVSGGGQENALPLADAAAVLKDLAKEAQQHGSFEAAGLVRAFLAGLVDSDADCTWASTVLFRAHATVGLLDLLIGGKLSTEDLEQVLNVMSGAAGSP